jgi:hypothetical protein
MTPYEREFRVTATENEIVALDYPGRCRLTRVAVVREGGGTFTIDLYNRAFTDDAVTITRIIDDGQTKCRLIAPGLAVRIGDVITVAGASVGGYNTSHRVTAVEPIWDDGTKLMTRVDTVVTDQAFSAQATGGTATLAIPAAEQPLYHVCDHITGTDDEDVALDVAYMNRDPLLNRNIGVNRKIYVKFADAATYRVAIRSTTDVVRGY